MVTFTITTVSPPAFVSLTNLAVNGGNVQISGATQTQIGTYSLTLQASVDSKVVTSNFQVTISDPCKTAVFQSGSPSPLIDMQVVRDYDSTKS
jgi:hypothetical protein